MGISREIVGYYRISRDTMAVVFGGAPSIYIKNTTKP